MTTQQVTLMGQAASAILWPAHMKIFRIDGDAMAPLLKEGDYVAVDTTKHSIREGIYAVQLGGGVAIRRLQPLPAGSVLLKCDHPLYSAEEVDASLLAKEGAIVGRVVFAEKRID